MAGYVRAIFGDPSQTLDCLENNLTGTQLSIDAQMAIEFLSDLENPIISTYIAANTTQSRTLGTNDSGMQILMTITRIINKRTAAGQPSSVLAAVNQQPVTQPCDLYKALLVTQENVNNMVSQGANLSNELRHSILIGLVSKHSALFFSYKGPRGRRRSHTHRY